MVFRICFEFSASEFGFIVASYGVDLVPTKLLQAGKTPKIWHRFYYTGGGIFPMLRAGV